jgi:MYXO-CTERM domain-containing protein
MLAPKSSVDDLMGDAIAIDGSTLAIGVPSDDSAGVDVGSVRVDELVNGWWELRQRVVPPAGAAGDDFGACVTLLGGVWSQTTELVPGSLLGTEFGRAIDCDGTRIIVGAPRDDAAGAATSGCSGGEPSGGTGAGDDAGGMNAAAGGGSDTAGATTADNSSGRPSGGGGEGDTGGSDRDGSPGGEAGDTADGKGSARDNGGCGCRVAGGRDGASPHPGGLGWALLLVGVALGRRQRRTA